MGRKYLADMVSANEFVGWAIVGRSCVESLNRIVSGDNDLSLCGEDFIKAEAAVRAIVLHNRCSVLEVGPDGRSGVDGLGFFDEFNSCYSTSDDDPSLPIIYRDKIKGLNPKVAMSTAIVKGFDEQYNPLAPYYDSPQPRIGRVFEQYGSTQFFMHGEVKSIVFDPTVYIETMVQSVLLMGESCKIAVGRLGGASFFGVEGEVFRNPMQDLIKKIDEHYCKENEYVRDVLDFPFFLGFAMHRARARGDLLNSLVSIRKDFEGPRNAFLDAIREVREDCSKASKRSVVDVTSRINGEIGKLCNMWKYDGMNCSMYDTAIRYGKAVLKSKKDLCIEVLSDIAKRLGVSESGVEKYLLPSIADRITISAHVASKAIPHELLAKHFSGDNVSRLISEMRTRNINT